MWRKVGGHHARGSGANRGCLFLCCEYPRLAQGEGHRHIVDGLREIIDLVRLRCQVPLKRERRGLEVGLPNIKRHGHLLAQQCVPVDL